MENGGFQSQLLSVMEVLAKAAVAEIDRRVDDSCAVLRLEVSQSRRDIELLKSKCELMEAELRRSRTRARRRAAERFSPSVKVVVSQEKLSADWDGHVDVEAPNRAEQCAGVEELAGEAEHIQIKEELAEEEEEEEEVWRSEPDDGLTPGAEQSLCFKASPPAHTGLFVDGYHSAEDPAHPEALVSPAALVHDTLPEQQQQQLNTNHNGTELVVKLEEEPDENAAPLEEGLASVTGEGDDRLWLSGLCGGDAGDPGLSFAAQRFEHIPVAYAPQSGLRLEDMVPRISHPGGKSLSVLVSAARAKRRARTFACKRPQAEAGNNALSQLHATAQGSLPQQQQQQHQYRDFAPGARSRDEDATAASPAAHPHPSLCGHSRGSLARRMAMLRAPWRSGEKRFSCTYCDKSFMRFGQLKEHLRSHTGEKPFSCLQCGRSFTKQCNLIRHAVVHSGEKPHACSLCGKCFTQRSSLKSHQKTAH